MESTPAYSASSVGQYPQPQSQVTYAQHSPQETPQQLYSEKSPGVQSQPVQPQQDTTQQTFSPRVYKTATPLNVLGRTGAPADCPACGQRSMTRVVNVVGNSNHMWAGIVFLLTGVCCFIPYLVDSMKDVEHRCGSCGVLLATVHKSGRVDVHQYH